ncbi:hypothetical protein ACQP2E_09860 [Actinoplanes sp. CA-015351]|uniref:hypothetical protein n=1 Tax=Actinoplanes sp. CA-015351 TaxID=3239897 RepID=UPI003D97DE16
MAGAFLLSPATVPNERGKAITLVTTKISTTEGMLLAWSKGHDMMPAKPARAAVAATVQGWFGPAVLSPGYAARAGATTEVTARPTPTGTPASISEEKTV